MDLVELKDKLNRSNVPHRWYSLNDGLKPDACILFKNYSGWEFFYLDEKGDRHDTRMFAKEEDAYEYLWKKMKYLLDFYGVKPRSDNY